MCKAAGSRWLSYVIRLDKTSIECLYYAGTGWILKQFVEILLKRSSNFNLSLNCSDGQILVAVLQLL